MKINGDNMADIDYDLIDPEDFIAVLYGGRDVADNVRKMVFDDIENRIRILLLRKERSKGIPKILDDFKALGLEKLGIYGLREDIVSSLLAEFFVFLKKSGNKETNIGYLRNIIKDNMGSKNKDIIDVFFKQKICMKYNDFYKDLLKTIVSLDKAKSLNYDLTAGDEMSKTGAESLDESDEEKKNKYNRLLLKLSSTTRRFTLFLATRVASLLINLKDISKAHKISKKKFEEGVFDKSEECMEAERTIKELLGYVGSNRIYEEAYISEVFDLLKGNTERIWEWNGKILKIEHYLDDGKNVNMNLSVAWEKSGLVHYNYAHKKAECKTIGNILNLGENCISARIYNARKELREYFEDEYNEYFVPLYGKK